MTSINTIKEMIYESLETFLYSDIGNKYSYIKHVFSTQIKLNNRLKVCAGKARWLCYKDQADVSSFIIEINPKIFTWFDTNELYDTVSHEVAHLIDVIIRNKTSHDKHWKAIHHSMNGSGLSTFKKGLIDPFNHPTKKYIYYSLKKGVFFNVSSHKARKLKCNVKRNDDPKVLDIIKKYNLKLL